MERATLAALGAVSRLTLGGGGLGQIWGETTREECVATLRAAVDAGIDLIDLAPGYGRGEAEEVFGHAFEGRVPAGVRVTTKCQLGSPRAEEVDATIRRRLARSLASLRVERVDLLFLHSNIVPDDYVFARAEDAELQDRFATRASLYRDQVVPCFESLKREGLIGAWGITGTGLPECIIDALGADQKPAVVQAISNCLDSPGAMRRYAEPPRARDTIAAAVAEGVGVMGIRAVQAGALTDGFDRPIPEDSQDWLDYLRAAPFRRAGGGMRHHAGGPRASLCADDGGGRHGGARRQESGGTRRVPRRGGCRAARRCTRRAHRRGAGSRGLRLALTRSCSGRCFEAR